jgi:hypothetical protein
MKYGQFEALVSIIPLTMLSQRIEPEKTSILLDGAL